MLIFYLNNEYWRKSILKRVPEHDVDFIASGLMIVNFVLSFYLGSLHIVGKHAEEQPLKIPRTILVILLIVCLITVIHKIVIFAHFAISETSSGKRHYTGTTERK